jgi:hypothetical protein
VGRRFQRRIQRGIGIAERHTGGRRNVKKQAKANSSLKKIGCLLYMELGLDIESIVVFFELF